MQVTSLKKVLDQLTDESHKKLAKLENLKSGKDDINIDTHDEKDEQKGTIYRKLPCRLNDFRFFIDNPNRNLEEDRLKHYFDSFGEVIDIFIQRSEKPKSSKAFITFSHYFESRPGRHHKILGFDVELESCYNVGEEPSSTILVEILDGTGDSLRKYFSTFGTIIDFRRQVNRKTNKLSRFVFIQCEKPETVEVIVGVKSHLIDGEAVDIIKVCS